MQYRVINQAGKVELSGLIAVVSDKNNSTQSSHIDEADSDPITAVFSLARSPGSFPDVEPFDAVKNSSSRWMVLLLSPATRAANEVVAAQQASALDEDFVVAAEDLCGPLSVSHPVEALRDVDWFAEFGLERDFRAE